MRRFNQPFSSTQYGPQYVQGDVIGVGYRPRTGTIFFTRNGKKLDDVAHGLKTQNFFPTVGANGPCSVHVNFGQMGFVFIEANVKKWGLAPMTGSLAPPPPYGSEQGSILLESGRDVAHTPWEPGHSRSRSGLGRMGLYPASSPGPLRSPTDISLAPLAHIPSHENAGEGTSSTAATDGTERNVVPDSSVDELQVPPPPGYSSPLASPGASRDDEHQRLLLDSQEAQPPIPSYDAAVGHENGNTQGDAHRS